MAPESPHTLESRKFESMGRSSAILGIALLVAASAGMAIHSSPERASNMCRYLARGESLPDGFEDVGGFLIEPDVSALVDRCQGAKPDIAVTPGCVIEGLKTSVLNGVLISTDLAKDVDASSGKYGDGVNMCR